MALYPTLVEHLCCQINQEISAYYDLSEKEGVVALDVYHGSPAEIAGVKPRCYHPSRFQEGADPKRIYRCCFQPQSRRQDPAELES